MGDVVRGELERHRQARREALWLRGSQVCAVAGITYRQLDYWARTGALVPARAANGSRTQRRYTAAQARAARVLGMFSEMGARHDAMASAAAALERLEEMTGVLLVWPDGEALVTDEPRDVITPAAYYVDLDVVASSVGVIHPALRSAL